MAAATGHDIEIRMKVLADIKKLSEFQQRLKDLNRHGLKVTEKGITDMNGKLQDNEKVAKKLSPLFARFKMELLSVMFGAQMVAKSMWGLLKPAMEAVGIFDLLNTTLLIFFLPTAQKLQQALLPILQWFWEADPIIKDAIGMFILLIGVFASLLATTAALALFGAGLTTLAAGFGLSAGALLLTLGLVAIAVVALGVGIGLLIANWGDIWGWIKEKFSDAMIVAGENVEKLIQWFQDLKDKIFDMLPGWAQDALDPLNTALDGVFDNLKKGIGKWKDYWESVKDPYHIKETEAEPSGASGMMTNLGRMPAARLGDTGGVVNTINNYITVNANGGNGDDMGDRISEEISRGAEGYFRR